MEGYFYRLPVWPRNIYFMTNTPRVTANSSEGVYEWFVLDGRPAEIGYDLEEAPRKNAGIYFYDADTGVLYTLWSNHKPPANEPAVLIEIARKFLPDAHPSACQPRAPAGGLSNDDADPALEDCGLPVLTLGYVAPSTTGAITDDGDYAFLSDPNDLTSAMHHLRGIARRARRRTSTRATPSASCCTRTIRPRHLPQAGGLLCDLVQVGDLVQHHRGLARRCWVRYQVTEVQDPDPPGAPPRKLLTIQVYSTPPTTGAAACSPRRTITNASFSSLGVIRTGNITGGAVHLDGKRVTAAEQSASPPGSCAQGRQASLAAPRRGLA